MTDDVRTKLTPAALKALRKSYDPKLMGFVATAKAASSYADSRGFIDGIGARYFVGPDGVTPPTSPMPPKERERTLIAILASGHRPAFALAVHCYWGMMEGLTVDAIADTLLLTGAYAGVDAFTNAVFTLGETLTLLQKAFDDAPAASRPEALSSKVLLPKLVGAFRR